MRRIRAVLGTALVLALALASPARADVYKYKNKNGVVVFTDKLSDLPPDRREYYNKLREERDAKDREAEQRLTPEQRQAREAERNKEETLRKRAEAEDDARRKVAIEQELMALKSRSQSLEGRRDAWRKRMQEAREKLGKLLDEYKKASEEYEGLAIKPSFTLLPGQADQLEAAKAKMEKLEKDVDAQVEEVEVTIPEEARKAGIPPGYLR